MSGFPDLHDALRFADHVRNRYDAEPGFITMNLPMLFRCVRYLTGIDNPIVCANINQRGFVCGGLQNMRTSLRRDVFALLLCLCLHQEQFNRGKLMEYVCKQTQIKSIVFGASSRNIVPKQSG